MGHLHLIGTSNFRTFKNHTLLELAPINIITGSNNSGKSSLSKLLLLIKDSFDKDHELQQLNFKGKSHYLAYFENSVNRNSESKSLDIELPFNIFSSKEYSIILKFYPLHKNKSYSAICKEVIIKNKNINLLESSIRKGNGEGENYEESLQNIFDIKINKELLISELITYQNKLKEEIIARDERLKNKKAKYSILDSINTIDYNLINSLFDNFDVKIKENSVKIDELYSSKSLLLFRNRLDIINEILIKFNSILPSMQIREYNEITGLDIIGWHGGYHDEEINIIDYIKNFTQFTDESESKNENNKILHELLQEIINNGIEELYHIFNDGFSYLPLTRGNIERLHYIEGSALNTTISELNEYIELDSFHVEKNFLEYWIKNFKIDNFNSLHVKSFPEFNACTLSLIEKDYQNNNINNSKVLADLGFGTSQLIIFLSKIAIEAAKNSIIYGRDSEIKEYNPHIILIEEPEAHLHPKWQALLADVIIDACSRFKTQFIIETHSEYLIRRLQYYIANKTIDTESINVFHVEQVDNSESIVRNMKLDFKGNFKTQFSEGFFDEATTLKDEIELAQRLNEYKSEIISFQDKFKTNIKCIILTEDEKAVQHPTPAISHILKSSGFNLDETAILSYNGRDKYQIAIGMARFSERLPNIKSIIIHQDRDGEYSKKIANIQKWIAMNNLQKTHVFVTKYNDLEGYFINSSHINYLFPNISHGTIDDIISAATEHTKNKSIEVLSNAYGGNSDVAEYVYNQNISACRHTKSMSKFINNQITIIEKTKSNILQLSPYIFDDSLKEIAQNVWPLE